MNEPCRYCGGMGIAIHLKAIYREGKIIAFVKIARPCVKCAAGLRRHGLPGEKCRWIDVPKGRPGRCPVCGATTDGYNTPVVPPIESWPPGPRILTIEEEVRLPQYVTPDMEEGF